MSDTVTASATIRSSSPLSTGGDVTSASISTSADAAQLNTASTSAYYGASSITSVSAQRSSLAQSWVSGMSQADQPFALAMLALLDLLLGNRDKNRDQQGLSGLASLLLQAGLGQSSRASTYYSQVSQQVTSVQSTAVQAVSYSQSSGGLSTSPTTSGQVVNTVA